MNTKVEGRLWKFPAKSKKYQPQTEPSLWQMGIVQQLEILFAYQPNKLKSGTLFAYVITEHFHHIRRNGNETLRT